MQQLLAEIAVADRDRRLRRSEEAWHHLHPLTDAPTVLPVDVERPRRHQLVARWSTWLDARRLHRRHPAHLTPGVRPSITRG